MSMLQVTPDELRNAAQRLNLLAGKVQECEVEMRGIVSSINWVGSTHEPVVHNRVNDTASILREAGSQLAVAAGGLTTYAQEIDDVR